MLGVGGLALMIKWSHVTSKSLTVAVHHIDGSLHVYTVYNLNGVQKA